MPFSFDEVMQNWLEWDIAQLQDEIVNGQDLSDYRKGQLNDKLAKLVSQKEVLDWEDTKTGTPTAADYEVQENYYQRLWNQNQDDIVNGLGSNTLVQGSDEWYDILKKGDDLLEKRDAYRMGKMGMLDGDEEPKAEEQATAWARTAFPNDSLKGDNNAQDTSDSYYQGMINAYGNIGEGISLYQQKITDSYYDGMLHAMGNDAGSGFISDADKYEAEKQKRRTDLEYQPSTDFNNFLSGGRTAARNNLTLAINMGDEQLAAQYQTQYELFDTLIDMNINIDPDNKTRYFDMENGLQAAWDLVAQYQDILNAQQGADKQQTQGLLDILSEEILAINRGMNVVGEAYLDEVDARWKARTITESDREAFYKEYYQSVIDRESLIEIESSTIKEDNLIMANMMTSTDLEIYGILEWLDIPLFSSEEDAVFAFKKEAMPLQLSSGKEHGAVLDTIEMINTDTGEKQTYYYYIDIKEGSEGNVAAQAILGMGGGEDRKLLHTHPVNGGWNRNFSGGPENQGIFSNDPDDYKKALEDLDFSKPSMDVLSFLINNREAISNIFGEMGDSTVPAWMGYGGIYVVGSGGEVKLYEGFGQPSIGSGQSTYGNTKEELSMVSTIDLY